jgi:hypothetical protein
MVIHEHFSISASQHFSFSASCSLKPDACSCGERVLGGVVARKEMGAA